MLELCIANILCLTLCDILHEPHIFILVSMRSYKLLLRAGPKAGILTSHSIYPNFELIEIFNKTGGMWDLRAAYITRGTGGCGVDSGRARITGDPLFISFCHHSHQMLCLSYQQSACETLKLSHWYFIWTVRHANHPSFRVRIANDKDQSAINCNGSIYQRTFKIQYRYLKDIYEKYF